MPRLKKKRAQPVSLSSCWRAEIDDHVQALAWSPDGTLLAAAAVSGSIILFDGEYGDIAQALPGHGFGTTSLSWCSGHLLASSGQDGSVRLWDPNSGTERLRLDGGAAWVEKATWSPDGTLLAAAAGRRLRIWNSEGDLLREFGDHPSTISDIQWKPRSHILTAAAYGGIFLWDADKATDAGQQLNWPGSSLVLAWSPDCRYVATGDQDATVHFWIAATSKDLQMWGYETKVRELSWNWSSRYLATGGSATAIVWDCLGKGPQGTRPTMLEGHEDVISAVAWQGMGPLLASSAADGTLFVWRPAQGKQPLAATAYNVGVTQIAWSPDDHRLAVGTEAGSVDVVIPLPGG